jgi:hypothetical protein
LKNERSLFDVDIDIGTRGKGIRLKARKINGLED